jgi:hypothetical protein
MPAGRPMKFESAEQMQELIDAYFENCDANDEIYTITGLAMALDTDRQTLVNYSKKEEFFDTIKKAKQRVENQVVSRALKGEYNSAVAIFLMKNNYGYQDKVEVRVGEVEDDAITSALKGIKNDK